MAPVMRSRLRNRQYSQEPSSFEEDSWTQTWLWVRRHSQVSKRPNLAALSRAHATITARLTDTRGRQGRLAKADRAPSPNSRFRARADAEEETRPAHPVQVYIQTSPSSNNSPPSTHTTTHLRNTATPSHGHSTRASLYFPLEQADCGAVTSETKRRLGGHIGAAGQRKHITFWRARR